MAIIFAMLKWHPDLLGRRFVVRKYQHSLKFLLKQRIVRAEYRNWITKLMGFDFEIQYHCGASNWMARPSRVYGFDMPTVATLGGVTRQNREGWVFVEDLWRYQLRSLAALGFFNGTRCGLLYGTAGHSANLSTSTSPYGRVPQLSNGWTQGETKTYLRMST